MNQPMKKVLNVNPMYMRIQIIVSILAKSARTNKTSTPAWRMNLDNCLKKKNSDVENKVNEILEGKTW